MTLIEELVNQIPMAEKLLEIKGVGIKTVSGFLAEVGDISRFNNPKELQKLLTVYAAAGRILGHNFPFYLGFRGGKGIAATAGLIISFDWRITLVCAALFFLNLAVTHYVSLGSMMVYVVFFAMAVIMGQAGCFALEPPYLYEMYVVIALLAVLAFWEHRANIKRLIAGTERKTYLSKKSEK